MHSAYFGNQAKSDSVQSSVFAAKGPAERFSLGVDGQLRRSVQPRDPDASLSVTTIGPLVGPVGGDLRLAADLAWLRRKEKPDEAHCLSIRGADLFSCFGTESIWGLE